ncbi:MAG: hypothetical protein NTX22_10500 [Ignavibacteriales bacterium]|nr:hypothetical protein [Ignavibacteriales bacterium]
MIGYVGPKIKGGKSVKSALFSTDGTDTVKDRLLDPEKYLNAQLEEISGQLKLKGDYIPSLCPSLGVIAFPSAFGCQVMWWEKDFPSVKAIINDDPMKVYEINKPSVTDGELGRILDYTKYFIEKTNGKIPIRLTDVQGPLDNAALIFGHSNLLMAMHTNPEEVHYLLKIVTEIMIDFIKTQREIVKKSGVEFVPSMFQPWLPDGFGISISNDESVMISSEMHDEFNVPYLNQLSEEFGGIYIHSCGNWLHQFSSLDKIKNLRGLEFGASEAGYEKVLDHFSGRIPLACRIGFNRDIKFNSMKDFVMRILKASKTNCGMFINVDIANGLLGIDWQETDLDEIYRIIIDNK